MKPTHGNGSNPPNEGATRNTDQHAQDRETPLPIIPNRHPTRSTNQIKDHRTAGTIHRG
jgi:hypothetical protein